MKIKTERATIRFRGQTKTEKATIIKLEPPKNIEKMSDDDICKALFTETCAFMGYDKKAAKKYINSLSNKQWKEMKSKLIRRCSTVDVEKRELIDLGRADTQNIQWRKNMTPSHKNHAA